MKKGLLVLNGGKAFTSRTREADRAWLRYVRGTHSPRVIVVPVAAMEKHEKTAQEISEYFGHLGTFCEYRLITSPLLANTEAEYAILDKVEAIVLTDGSPIDMVERLQGTHTEKSLHMTLERRAAIMATGASAMALGAVYWFAGEWLPGLAVAPHLAFLAHHNLVAMRLPPERLLPNLPQGVTLIGADQETNLICHPDDTYEVAGYGTVTVYHSLEQQSVYQPGASFQLVPPGPESGQELPQADAE